MATASEDAEDCITRHSVAYYDRGGQRRVNPLINLASIRWERTRSDFTTATAVISARNCEIQAQAIADIEAHFHELVIWRGDSRCWEGPIRDVKWYRDRVEIIADDAGEYINNAVCSKEWPPPSEGGQPFMTERVREIITYELTTPYTMDIGLTTPEVVTVPRWENLGSGAWPFATYGPPANVLPFLDVRASTAVPGGLLTDARVTAFQMYVGEHLKNLARGGLDFTTVGRALTVWDSAYELGRTRPLTDADFLGDVVVIASGGDQASIGHIVAQGEEQEDGTTIIPVGSAGGVDPFYGVWNDLRTREDEDEAATQQALNTQARRILSGRKRTPLQIIAPSGIRLGVGLTIDDLIPGVILPVRATMNLKPVSQDQVLDRVTVNETANGETIDVALSPAGELEVIGE